MDIHKLQQRCRSRSLNCCHVSLKSFKTTSNVSHRWTKQPSLKELTAVSHTQLFITSLSCAIWLHWWETNLVAGQRALTWARAQRRSKDQHPSIHHSEILQQWWLYFRDARSLRIISQRWTTCRYILHWVKPCNIYPHKQPEPQVRWRKPQDLCLTFSRTPNPATRRRDGGSTSLGKLSTNPTSWLPSVEKRGDPPSQPCSPCHCSGCALLSLLILPAQPTITLGFTPVTLSCCL